jgi:hypothetical protein
MPPKKNLAFLTAGLTDLPNTLDELLSLKFRPALKKFAVSNGLHDEFKLLSKTIVGLGIKNYGVYTRKDMVFIRDMLGEIFFDKLDDINATILMGGRKR